MPRNKRKHPTSRYERMMLAAINSLPFKFNSPGEPNIPERPSSEESFPERRTPKPAKLQRLVSSPGPTYTPTGKEHVKQQYNERNPSVKGTYVKRRAAPPKSQKGLMN